MLHKYRFLSLIIVSLSIKTCYASSFDLGCYRRTKQSPHSYTLALLDKSLVIQSLESGEVPETVRPFIRPTLKESNNQSLEVVPFADEGSPAHFVVRLKFRKGVLSSARLTEVLLGEKEDENLSSEESSKEDSDGESLEGDNEENFNDDLSENSGRQAPLEYAASMVLFPIEPIADHSDEMLAYLLGNWQLLLNTTSIVPLFGLRVTTSIGVACKIGEQGKEISTIKEIIKETHRRSNPQRNTLTQQRSLCSLRDFDITPGSDGLEKVKLMPAPNWGRALLDGDDCFKFHLHSKAKKPNKIGYTKSFNTLCAMYDIAKEVYAIYSRGNTHEDFLAYVDEAVGEELQESLNKNLRDNWQKYFKKDHLLYAHWTVWLRARKDGDISAIGRKIKEEGFEADIEIGRQHYTAAQLVRSLPLHFRSPEGRSNYYWFDRGRWYRIAESRFDAIKKQLQEVTVNQEELFLPNFSRDMDSEDYKELAYNKAAVAAMGALIGDGKPVREALLLDRENVSLGGRDDKFEFADILMQRTDGKYFLIHVKREAAGEFDHHRTQAERCALYLGENLDRSALPSILIASKLHDFYKTYISLPTEEKADFKATNGKKVVEQPRSSDFWTKLKKRQDEIKHRDQKTSKGTARRKKMVDDFVSFVVEDILNVRKKERQFIRRIVESGDIKPLVKRFEPYGDTFGRCLDALEDYILYGIKNRVTDAEMESFLVSPDRIDFVGRFLGDTLNLLERHPVLVKDNQGILSRKEKKNITIVLAIIGDGAGNTDFHRQQLWGIDQTRRLVERHEFGFQVVFIKDQTPKKDKENSEILITECGETLAPELLPMQPSLILAKTVSPILFTEPEEVTRARRKAENTYGISDGYKGLHKEIFRDADGKRYVRILIDGSKGDCCFHALGIARETLVEKMCDFIDMSEAELVDETKQARVQQATALVDLQETLMTTARSQDISAFKNHDLTKWKDVFKENLENYLDAQEQEQLSQAFDVLIQQQILISAEANPEQLDLAWLNIAEQTQLIKFFVDKGKADIDRLIKYGEFVGKCVADFWKKVGDDQLTSQVENYLRKIGVLENNGNMMREITQADLDFSVLEEKKEIRQKKRKRDSKPKENVTLDSIEVGKLRKLSLLGTKHKNYIKYKYEFSEASAERKKAILKDFYLTQREWLDPCAFIHLGDYFNFRVKLFKHETYPIRGKFQRILILNAQTPDADNEDGLPCRLMMHVNNNHYDLLHLICNSSDEM